jgi:hypothetical protein
MILVFTESESFRPFLVLSISRSKGLEQQQGSLQRQGVGHSIDRWIDAHWRTRQWRPQAGRAGGIHTLCDVSDRSW